LPYFFKGSGKISFAGILISSYPFLLVIITAANGVEMAPLMLSATSSRAETNCRFPSFFKARQILAYVVFGNLIAILEVDVRPWHRNLLPRHKEDAP